MTGDGPTAGPTAGPTLAVLYAFAGLPGSGKTTLARHLARRLRAAYLRIDSVERAVADATGRPAGPAGYVVAYRLAEDNLRLGLSVVADSVNPLAITRDAWRAAAANAAARCVEIEIVCSDPAEHRARVQARPPDAGRPALTWDEARTRAYDPWPTPPLVIDTAGRTPEQSVADLERRVMPRGGF